MFSKKRIMELKIISMKMVINNFTAYDFQEVYEEPMHQVSFPQNKLDDLIEEYLNAKAA